MIISKTVEFSFLYFNFIEVQYRLHNFANFKSSERFEESQDTGCPGLNI